MRKAVIIVVSWAIAIAVFWLIFFNATPALCALVPASSWKGFCGCGHIHHRGLHRRHWPSHWHWIDWHRACIEVIIAPQ